MSQATLRQLADLEPDSVPMLSVYLDLRFDLGTPVRPGLTVLKDRLRDIEKTLWPRGEAYDEFTADVAVLDAYLESEVPESAQGLVMFISAHRNLAISFSPETPVENHIAFDALPHLFYLARLVEDRVTAVVALLDSETARLFVASDGDVTEVEDEHTDAAGFRALYHGREGIKHYERHVSQHRQDFAREIADAITQLAQREAAQNIYLIGQDEPVALVRVELEPLIAERFPGRSPRLSIQANSSAVRTLVEPLLEQIESEREKTQADLLIDAIRAHGLGVAGTDQTRQALERGQVETLIITEDSMLSDVERDAFTRMAITTDARIEIIPHHDGLRQFGGVGALLRYRSDR